MQIYRGIEELTDVRDSVVAIGSFDGVHLGHRHILQWLCTAARERNLRSVVITFDPHPRQVLKHDPSFFTINTLQKNLSLMEEQGVDAALVLPFTKALAACDYRDFLQKYVVDAVHAKCMLMGPNHTIGYHKEGNSESIAQFCAERHVQVLPIPEYMLNETGVHSSAIRSAIRHEDWETVNELLGYEYEPHSISNVEK